MTKKNDVNGKTAGSRVTEAGKKDRVKQKKKTSESKPAKAAPDERAYRQKKAKSGSKNQGVSAVRTSSKKSAVKSETAAVLKDRVSKPKSLKTQISQAAAASAQKKKSSKKSAKKAVPSAKNSGTSVKPVLPPANLPIGSADSSVRIIFLGGLEQIGMNITAVETDEAIVVIDCGMAFPDSSMPGIDLVIPDVTYLKEHEEKLRGFFITHGHEDHIGALPYVLRDLNIPVYCTCLTRKLIELKLSEAGLLGSAKLYTTEFGDFIEAGDITVEYIKTNHSIQDAAALALHTPAGILLHTGDFKVDLTPVYGDTIDLQRFAELGRQGVLALMCDSTNALRPGFTMSEKSVGHTFESVFGEYRDRRIIVATFASNVDRVQQIISVAEKYGRKVVIDGRSMINVIGAASELGYIRMREDTLIDIADIRKYPDEKVVLIVTGSQGEPMAALSRMAEGLHRKITLGENDLIILSSTPIPGNEKSVSKIINDISRRHAKVINEDTHVSGHACAEDIKLIYALVHPRYAVPVHGEYRHRLAQRELAIEVGMSADHVVMPETGDVVEVSEGRCLITGSVQAGPVLVDGLGVGDVGNIVLKDRQTLSQNGILIVVMTLEKGSSELIAGPDIVSRGFIYVRDNADIIEEARGVVLDAFCGWQSSDGRDWAHLKNMIRDELSNFIRQRMKRNPVIMPIISET